MTHFIRCLRNTLFGTQFVAVRYGLSEQVAVAHQDAIGNWYALILGIPIPLRDGREWWPLLGAEIAAYYLELQGNARRYKTMRDEAQKAIHGLRDAYSGGLGNFLGEEDDQ